MAFLDINPEYRTWLAAQGLATVEQFLSLSGVVLSGHPDRHVARLVLDEAGAALGVFLKREHRVPWRDRLVNAWQGFGAVSKSAREFRLLGQLRREGIGCPEPIAVGEAARGRAFLLLREIVGAQDLRAFLRNNRTISREQRRQLAVALGEAIAAFHAAGFDHPDLYSKHVLVCTCKNTCTEGATEFAFLDWARSRWRRRIAWTIRARDLAALDATLAEQLASPRDRLTCLCAYLNFSLKTGTARNLPRLSQAARDIRRRSDRLLQRRRIREQRQESLAFGTQNLIWLDGEALCVTREFRTELGAHPPAWLLSGRGSAGSQPALTREVVTTPRGRTAQLVRRRTNRPLARLWAWLRRRPLTSPELDQAGILFRLQRYGIETPKLLAVGQRHRFPWHIESFLLLEPLAEAVGLAAWLAHHSEEQQRQQVLAETGRVLRRMHDASCYFRNRAERGDDSVKAASFPLQVRTGEEGGFHVVLAEVAGIRKRHHPSETLVQADLAQVQAWLAPLCSLREQVGFLRSYWQPDQSLGGPLARNEKSVSATAPVF
jgi:tRNA A-37 threonylcarbamoyl transferase component Bud32